jgi:hypothetical protein
MYHRGWKNEPMCNVHSYVTSCGTKLGKQEVPLSCEQEWQW